MSALHTGTKQLIWGIHVKVSGHKNEKKKVKCQETRESRVCPSRDVEGGTGGHISAEAQKRTV